VRAVCAVCTKSSLSRMVRARGDASGRCRAAADFRSEALDGRAGAAGEGGRLYARQYKVENNKYTINVETVMGSTSQGGDQAGRAVVVTTDIPGRLLLHWGL